MACVFGDAARSGGSRFDAASGAAVSWGNWGMFSNTANSAIGARRHMALYGTTSEQLGWVAVNGRRNAALNPQAVMRKPITIEDHQASRMIVDPLHLLDCCLITDGAVAIIVAAPAAPPAAGAGPDPRHGPGTYAAESRVPRLVVPAAPAGLRVPCLPDGRPSPADIDVAQLYDNFTVAVLFWLEHAGFCGRGESGPFVDGGRRIALDGELPVNTAGGNLSESYMQGWLHVVEGVRQLRGACGARQVPGAEVCLVTGRGMTLNTSACLVLGK